MECEWAATWCHPGAKDFLTEMTHLSTERPPFLNDVGFPLSANKKGRNVTRKCKPLFPVSLFTWNRKANVGCRHRHNQEERQPDLDWRAGSYLAPVWPRLRLLCGALSFQKSNSVWVRPSLYTWLSFILWHNVPCLPSFSSSFFYEYIIWFLKKYSPWRKGVTFLFLKSSFTLFLDTIFLYFKYSFKARLVSV